jgi:signal transduction histidine kinase
MEAARARTLAWTSFALMVVFFAAQAVLAVLNRAGATGSSGTWGFTGALGFLLALPLLAFPVVGLLIALRRPENSIGWVLLAIGVMFSIPAAGYARYALFTRGGDLSGGGIAAAIDSASWIPFIGLAGCYVLLLFPDGHLPSRSWRWFARAIGIGMALGFIGLLFSPKIDGYPKVHNPLAIPALEFLSFGLVAVPIGIVGAAISLVGRYRRSSGAARLQLRWLVAAASIVAALFGSTFVLSLVFDSGPGPTPLAISVLQSLSFFTFGLIPAAIGVAVLKYRLYEIDVVINKTVVFASLALFITAVYVAIVVGVGALVGATNDPVLSAAAAAVVALAFQPVRRRAQRLADRVVYGKRATPYEILSEFSERLAGTYAAEDLLPRMVRILAEGTGAARADVWVRSGDTLRPAATWPPEASALDPVPADPLPEGAIAVRHQGELLGALSVAKKPGESLSAQEDKLIADLASQAGLVLRNAGLTQELLARLEELQASRLRLVSAQDEERRKIERNLHDGAQQQLVALAVKLRLAEQMADRDLVKTKEMLAQLRGDAGEALETLRDLARGIYPPLLADKGLAAALESQARKSPVPVTIEADGTGRYPQDAEAAVYFCCLEALQNVAKYANASQATVRLLDGDSSLRFEVRDDGSGFDPAVTAYGTGLQGMADRLAALGGSIEVTSAPGTGTSVLGTVPVPA